MQKIISKVLITGVAGFIGSNLLDYLFENTSWQIDGVDNLSTGNKKILKLLGIKTIQSEIVKEA